MRNLVNPLRKDTGRYQLETVARACGILRLFGADEPALSLRDVVERTGLERTIVFRLLRTLAAEGLLRRVDGRRYASCVHIHSQKRFRIGYASQADDSFSHAVTKGLRWQAEQHSIDLVEVENHYGVKAALRNAHALASQKVDLAIEFQVYERIGAQLAAVFEQVAIPVIAVEIPHPGAVFYGIDNYRVGQMAGKALAKAARDHWNSEVDELLLLGLEVAGPLLRLRLTGAESVIRKSLTAIRPAVQLDSRGQMETAHGSVRRHLRFAPRRRTLVAGVNDFAVLGALRAFEEAGRASLCFAAGIGAVPEARREMRSPHSRLVGSVANFPERYGEGLILLALDILHHKPVQPTTYAPVQLVTPGNIEEFYPSELFAGSE